jgi:4-alpha-glucanotransferase
VFRRFRPNIVLRNDASQGWWQALPLGPTGYGNSPYQSMSSFAGNELLISPDSLISDGLIQASLAQSGFSADAVDYDSVIPFKRRLLETAWANFKAGLRSDGDLAPAYDEFCARPLYVVDTLTHAQPLAQCICRRGCGKCRGAGLWSRTSRAIPRPNC